MGTELAVDLVFIDPEQRDDVKRLASLGYRPVEIAVSLGIPAEDRGNFVRDATTPGTTAYELIKEGVLVTRAAPEVKLHQAAEAGNVDAIKELNIVHFRHAYNQMIDDMDADNI